MLKDDIDIIIEKDPATNNVFEVVLCNSGFHAIVLYKISHFFYEVGLILIAKIIAYLNKFITGIEIHPAASIGGRLFIDHGMGVVIGETSIIGNNVLIYQGVTLGSTGKETGKRHPTIGNGVLIGAGAKILGNITIGDNSKIGAGAVVVKDVPSNCTVVGVPGVIIKKSNKTKVKKSSAH